MNSSNSKFSNSVFAVFRNRDDADNAVEDLKDAGIRVADISILTSHAGSTRTEVTDGAGNSVAESTAAGATTGGVIGAIAGLLIGAGIVTLPPLGAIAIAGPLAAALGISTTAASTIAGGAIGAAGGGIVGALTSLGLPEETAQYYEDVIRDKGVLVTVAAKDTGDEQTIKQILQDNNADKISLNY